MRFAPPPKRLPSGQLAVPIDIEHITAGLSFDTRTQRASGEATLAFLHGIDHGSPVFDLRQPVTGAWLDGTRLGPAAVGFERFGARHEQALRVAGRKLRSGTPHQLRLAYDLAAPPLRASDAGGYPPELTWTGDAVHFNFGFTDLGGGRYLEAWVPANLIYDQFAFDLTVRVLHTPTPHTLITNGEIVDESRNEWRVRYPGTFTALSPMLQLHPTETVERRVRRAGGRRLEAWKFRASSIDLDVQLDNIVQWLARNEAAIGPYPHGKRFVAFMHRGGMEYDGACTASPDALEHEVFHSWWARGLKPASQNDGWIDEAWTVYHDNGAARERPFDFAEPPVRLSPSTPWNRATPIESYRLGSRFFEGIAARIGVEKLHSVMNEFYSLHAPGIISTGQLETHILDRTQDDVIRRAFERWVYGRMGTRSSSVPKPVRASKSSA